MPTIYTRHQEKISGITSLSFSCCRPISISKGKIGKKDIEASSQPQLKTMEVHKHPHNVTHTKKWGEYFLEFLMIFLAVTLGFFAETLRENITEHKRAREFAVSLVKDLTQDTMQLKSYREYFQYAADNIDTLMQLLARANPRDIPPGKLYWYGLWGGAPRFFIPNDATIQQMKSSGSLRYFKKTVAADIATYDRFCRIIKENDEMQQGIYIEVRKTRAQIFDFRYNDVANTIVQATRGARDYNKIDSFMKSNPGLLSYDKSLFNQYIELVRSRFIRRNVNYSDSLLKYGAALIATLKKEYSVDTY